MNRINLNFGRFLLAIKSQDIEKHSRLLRHFYRVGAKHSTQTWLVSSPWTQGQG